MTLPFTELQRLVYRKLKKTAVVSLVRFIFEKEPSQWGFVKTRNWISKSVYLTLYKHLKGIGYSSLLLQIKRWYEVGSATLAHNM